MFHPLVLFGRVYLRLVAAIVQPEEHRKAAETSIVKALHIFKMIININT